MVVGGGGGEMWDTFRYWSSPVTNTHRYHGIGAAIPGDGGGGGDVSPPPSNFSGGIVPPRFLKALTISIHIFAF